MYELKIVAEDRSELNALRKSITETPLGEHFTVSESIGVKMREVLDAGTNTITVFFGSEYICPLFKESVSNSLDTWMSYGNVVFDMPDAIYIDTYIINMFIKVRNKGCTVSIINVGKEIWDILDLIQMTSLFKVEREP